MLPDGKQRKADSTRTTVTTTAVKCFGNELVAFTLSGYLPGEYLLRVFPLICKATRMRRLSLSLLGSDEDLTSSPRSAFFGFEGPLYGIYSIWRDLQQIIARDHVITAIKLQEEKKTNLLHIKSLESVLSPTVIQYFPKLTKLDIDLGGQDIEKSFLTGVWKLPLTSLTVRNYPIPKKENGVTEAMGLPAFAGTLHSLHTKWNDHLLHILAPFCFNLQDIGSTRYHKEIMGKNAGLTSLTLCDPLSPPDYFGDLVDLTVHGELRKLVIINGHGDHPFVAEGTQLNLEQIALHYADPVCAAQFLRRCSALKHLSLVCKEWKDLVRITKAVNPNKCQRLTLDLSPNATQPCVDEVEKSILQRGFQINEDFLTRTSDAPEQWGKMMKLIPHIKKLQTLQGRWKHYSFLHAMTDRCNPFSNSFHTLSVIEIDSAFEWDRLVLFSFVKQCSMLKEFTLSGFHFLDTLELESQSLCKLKFGCELGFSKKKFPRLTLPKLTQLSLLNVIMGEGLLVKGLLDRDSRIVLPQLHVLSIDTGMHQYFKSEPVVVSCSGHESLSQLIIDGTKRDISISKISLRRLPNLRRVSLDALPASAEVEFNVSGECDVLFSRRLSDWIVYNHRKGKSQQVNFEEARCFDEHTRQWVEKKREVEVDVDVIVTKELKKICNRTKEEKPDKDKDTDTKGYLGTPNNNINKWSKWTNTILDQKNNPNNNRSNNSDKSKKKRNNDNNKNTKWSSWNNNILSNKIQNDNGQPES